MTVRKVALIGSFRVENYPSVQSALRIFTSHGLEVLSPSGAEIVSGREFVRFSSDRPDASDAAIQTETLEKIFSADAVYVVTGKCGYVGKTTCYEIGRIVQRGQPLYFSEMPDDLPIHVPPAHVTSPEDFVLRFFVKGESACGLFQAGVGEIFDGERRLTGLSPVVEGATAVPA